MLKAPPDTITILAVAGYDRQTKVIVESSTGICEVVLRESLDNFLEVVAVRICIYEHILHEYLPGPCCLLWNMPL